MREFIYEVGTGSNKTRDDVQLPATCWYPDRGVCLAQQTEQVKQNLLLLEQAVGQEYDLLVTTEYAVPGHMRKREYVGSKES